ncbi:MAG TPA: T9SS type A sorting domain-containing protein [Bacteroidetes bacterium]|nr:T9SS type A sorting domain-containing protein [Bacteroidota bacterium]
MLAAAPDGRVYAATDSLVWRTVEPAVAVAGAAGPEPTGNVSLVVEPNPATRQTAVRWRQASAGSARVSVLDARGREVLVVSESFRQPGEHREEVDASGLAAGAYLVRVVTPGGTASGRLSVMR